ncbi:sugar ABC transporter ATP-binding protein [Vibrio penaeicida]|uniref:sugar ABC transporter ATP-binding protein n=1 Tax=Vibrio penaeicida TaxID=104609 RepID=UPI000CE9F19C|nr:sugar ABC transporter ATP-binding protein [Vibrio penaeicida]
MKSEKRLEMNNICKRFFETKALDAVDFTCQSGEVHALVGLNGAGKSTLTKVLGGVYSADEGEILLNGSPIRIEKPSDANSHGISTIHQEYSLINELTVFGNIFLGREIHYSGTPFLNKKEMIRRVQAQLDLFGLTIDPAAPVHSLNSGEKQIVEIIRSIMTDSWLIVMDEPTSALSEEDKLKLFEFVEKMTQQNISIIYISHHMPEIFGLADRVTVMRDGKIVLSDKVVDTSENNVIRAMTGDDLDDFVKPEKRVGDEVLLSLKNASKAGSFEGVSFDVRCGEIVVMTGLRGCGAPDVAKAIFGLDKHYTGDIFYQGERLKRGQGPDVSVNIGMGFVSENRDKNGILPSLSVEANIVLPFIHKRTKSGLIQQHDVEEVVSNAILETGTKTESPAQEIQFLSGGNKQKICFSRWLDKDLKLLILLEPTRGIDVHAKADIYRIIEDLASRGVAILVLSYEIDEVIMLADRVLTMYEGRTVTEYGLQDMDKEQMLADMAGVKSAS